MCGIVGKISIANCKKEDILKPIDLLFHRGPDEQNILCNDDVVLGHTRLSIIDTSHGHQPMNFIFEDKSYSIVFNGEIYNYKELGGILKKENIKIETNSDTEVLLKWLAYKGIEDGIKSLNGMFAISLYCKEDDKLYLARDRMGIKPLYYSKKNNGLFFSSELESLVSFKEIDKKVNQEALEQFMYFGYPVAPNTMYEDVFEQRPGTILEYDLKSNLLSETTFWSVDNYTRDYQGTYGEAVEQLDSILQEVISDQVISDVGYGTFLSGGIDSSLVTSIVSRMKENKFNAYTVSFDDRKYDELPYAKMVANKYKNINHIVYKSSNFNLDSNFIDLILKHVGQPFADSSCIPTYLIANEVRKNEKVILSGDGGDELFLGYETFSWLDKIDRVKSVPKLIREFIQFLFYKLPLDMIMSKDLNRQVNKAIKYSLGDKTDLAFSLNSVLDLVDLEKITDRQSFKWLEIMKTDLALESHDSYTVLQRFLIKVKLSGDMLRKVDSMTMANSIEVRVPLLDNRIVDFALSLPVEFLYRGGVKKSILRDVAKRYLPEEVITHKKWGFSIPMHKVLEKELIERYKYLFSKYDILNKELIADFYQFKENKDTTIYKDYSQYTIDHINWMAILLYRWIEKNRVICE
jgi:asparagine synthase (glutamine-hydrolysing)